jgi:phosphate starvation-inducible PhoH-like protein
MVDFDRVRKMMERSIIEVAPLAFMRGRTLNDSFVILDEAQNTTNEQMKMFLTRLGYGSKAVITGDITQVDLPVGTRSGLKQAWGILKDITDIKFVFFTEKDVVRHRLVQDVILAYEHMEAQKESSRAGAKRAAIPAQGEGGGLRYEGASGSESWEYDAVGEDDSSADGENGGGAQPGSG